MSSQPTQNESHAVASMLPADVLWEIFLLCRPESPLDEVQPNTKIAPMLLCHVCSSWRQVALSCSPLWSHIRLRLPIRWEDGPKPIAWNAKTFLRNLEFLRWWRENQGSTAPFIQFQFYRKEKRSSYEELPLTSDILKFFIEYLSSAQHLDVGQFSEYLFKQDGTSGDQALCPKLQSLVNRYPNSHHYRDDNPPFSEDQGQAYFAGSDDDDDEDEDDEEHADDEMDEENEDDEPVLKYDVNELHDPILTDEEVDDSNSEGEGEHPNSNNEEDDDIRPNPHLLPFPIPPTLRRLCINKVGLPRIFIDAFASWSSLTHLSLSGMYMHPRVWYSLIRGLPDLQWGYFDIFLLLVSRDHNPPQFTLPYLSTLSVTLDNSEGNGYDDPIEQLFKNLYLPALNDLAIYVDADPSDLQVAMKINNVLTLAPAVTKLTLGLQFLGFFDFFGHSTTNWQDVQKLPMLAPHLSHLLLDMCYLPGKTHFTSKKSDYGATLSQRLGYWKRFLHPTRWLDLANPANAIRRITAIVKIPSKESPLVKACIQDALELAEKHSKGMDHVVFEIVAEDKQALSPNGVGWRTWGRSI